MAAAKKRAKEKDDTAAVERETAPAPTYSGPDPSMTIIVNRLKSPLDVPLRDGNIRLGPWLPGMNIHKSDPVLKKRLNAATRNMVKRGMIGLETPGGE